jgi:hypothetical protein
MANIFENTPQTIGGAFTAENCTLDLGVEKAIVQRVQFSIERPINFIYEIGQSNQPAANVYYVGGRRRGQATFERVVGGSGTFAKFVNNYGPLCDQNQSDTAQDIVLKAKGGCNIGGQNSGATITYTLKTPRITALSGSVSAQDIVITESVTMVFLDLDYAETGADGAPLGGFAGGGAGPGGAP